MDTADLENRFTYHPPQGGQVHLHEVIRARGLDLALYLNAETPEGREKSLAITHLEQCVMWANAAIARSAGRRVS